MRGSKCAHTYDFSTLYTFSQHDLLKFNLTKFVDKVFKFNDEKFLIPNFSSKKALSSKDHLLECLILPEQNLL